MMGQVRLSASHFSPSEPALGIEQRCGGGEGQLSERCVCCRMGRGLTSRRQGNGGRGCRRAAIDVCAGTTACRGGKSFDARGGRFSVFELQLYRRASGITCPRARGRRTTDDGFDGAFGIWIVIGGSASWIKVPVCDARGKASCCRGNVPLGLGAAVCPMEPGPRYMAMGQD